MPINLTPPKPVPFTTNCKRTAVHFGQGASVLPCTADWGRLNPSNPQSHALVENGDQVLVLSRWFDRDCIPNRVVKSSGAMHVTLGTFIELRHDQTSRRLGDFRIIGIVNVREDGNESIGNVPARSLPVSVFK